MFGHSVKFRKKNREVITFHLYLGDSVSDIEHKEQWNNDLKTHSALI